MGTSMESATTTGESTEVLTLADTATAEDMAAMQFVSSDQSALTVTIDGIEVTAVTADQDSVAEDSMFSAICKQCHRRGHQASHFVIRCLRGGRARWLLLQRYLPPPSPRALSAQKWRA
ncbi:unnamed protein product [Prorocentrum cordatum]|uniref:Uncharacterized protein n=1 Tax=Prorocentrum cordatum TaxID=2364126 RepID=A0ABN9X8Z9_9DINO|nr:unnamed protein product [Polarella glacialis]